MQEFALAVMFALWLHSARVMLGHRRADEDARWDAWKARQ